MKRLLLVLVMLVPGCTVALTPAGQKVTSVSSDLVQAMPGHPMDKCKIVKHLSVNVGGVSPCPGERAAVAALRNAAGETEANVLILTSVKTTSDGCVYSGNGMAVLCDDETLRAAALK